MINILEEVKIVCKECLKNKSRLWKLSLYELKTLNSNTMLGFTWNFINPMLQIFIYWLVFAVGLNAAPDKGGHSHIIWLIAGVIPWIFIGNTLSSTTMSIYGYSGILKRMNFPMAIVPVKSVLSAFMAHILAMGIVIIIMLFAGVNFGVKSIFIIYFMFCSLAFLISYALIVSAITVLIKDFQKLTQSIVRLMFYITPVVWVQDNLPNWIIDILQLNPLAYIINGYRDSLLYESTFIINYNEAIYFWGLTMVLFIIGCKIHVRFRRNFFDLI